MDTFVEYNEYFADNTNGLGKNALEIVEQAKKITDETRQKAHLLLKTMEK